ncbi:MAG TPA: GntR family transcriptional regulator [Methylovirgula sp.]|nr:GntR family transcriptional regulator [Methylovirgula sp.]
MKERNSGEQSSAAAPNAAELSLTDQAYSQLEEMITTLKLAPGTVLSEQALAKELHIGRTPVREALQRLGRDGLVVVLPRRGILVSEINLRSQLRLLETRRVLENLVAKLAAERATEDELQTFAELARNMRQAAQDSDDIAFMRLDRLFNEFVAKTARNEFALRSLGSLSALSRRFWYQHYKQAADLPLCANLHAAVCEAIARRDQEGAAQTSDRLMDYIESFARRTLDT